MIVDTSALVAILFAEPERARFAGMLATADRRAVSAVVVVELSIVLSREIGLDAGTECDRFLRDSDIMIEAVTARQASLARDAYLKFGKGRHPAGLNFGDCFSYALAKATGEPLLFKGDDFRRTDLTFAA